MSSKIRELIYLAMLICMSTQSLGAEVLLRSPQGDLLGTTAPADNRIHVFKGIPYALPPIGSRRWKPAEPFPTWRGVRKADTFGPDCMSLSTFIEPIKKPEASFFYHPPTLPSEDCLYLNVWAPKKDDSQTSRKRPVMVWIHSGGAVMGSGSWPLYDGTELARKGVIVVTFNYRLGIFGFFSHPELTAESPHHASGNYGITDQIQALKWVQENIAAFGGDPGNITIFGESFGSASVSILMASPLSKGLFHRAIGQSSAAFNRLPELTTSQFGIPSSESAGLAFAKSINQESVQNLRDIPAIDLFEISTEKLYSHFPNLLRMITVDGWVVTDQPYDTFALGKQHKVPVIVGFNSDEGYFGKPPAKLSREAYIEGVKQQYGPLADEYLSFYPPATGQDAARLYGLMGWWMESWAKMMGGVSSNTYLYYFSHLPPGSSAAFHAADISYVFNNEQYSVRFSPNMPADPPRSDDIALADLMSDYWVAFATTGNPAVEGLPVWKPYSNSSKHFMQFDNGKAHPSEHLLPGSWELQEKVMRWKKRVLYKFD